MISEKREEGRAEYRRVRSGDIPPAFWMKKAFLFIAMCSMLLCCAGCGARMPAMAVDGTPWNKDWIILGQALGVEEPGFGLTLRDSKGSRNMYYNAWSIGEGQPHVNMSGEKTTLYDAQLVLLLVDLDTEEDARLTVDDWLELSAENYKIAATARQTYNGQEYTVLTYTFSSEKSSFSHGVSAFTVFNSQAISAEFTCRDTFQGNPDEILADFLTHCHYAAE